MDVDNQRLTPFKNSMYSSEAVPILVLTEEKNVSNASLDKADTFHRFNAGTMPKSLQKTKSQDNFFDTHKKKQMLSQSKARTKTTGDVIPDTSAKDIKTCHFKNWKEFLPKYYFINLSFK